MNATLRPRLALVAALVFLAGLTAFAPPGLCPCWLIGDVHDIHPHPDGHPERPHSHSYLLEMFVSGTAAIAKLALVPAASLILALVLAARWRTVVELVVFSRPWVAPPQAPPPR